MSDKISLLEEELRKIKADMDRISAGEPAEEAPLQINTDDGVVRFEVAPQDSPAAQVREMAGIINRLKEIESQMEPLYTDEFISFLESFQRVPYHDMVCFAAALQNKLKETDMDNTSPYEIIHVMLGLASDFLKTKRDN